MATPAACQPTVLAFRVAVFNRGPNTTVRRGRKWHGATQARLQLEDGSLSAPVSLRTELRKFSMLTEADLRFEHDPACHTVAGLRRVLQCVYPGFSDDEEVTLCHFHYPPG